MKAPDSSSSSSNIATIAGASVAVVVVVLVLVGALIIVFAVLVRKTRKRDYRLSLMELKEVDERLTGKELCTCEIYIYLYHNYSLLRACLFSAAPSDKSDKGLKMCSQDCTYSALYYHSSS